MRSYWIWLLFLIVAWLLAIAHFGVSLSDMPLRMIGSACFFALFFLSPLLRQQNGWHFLLFISLAALAVAALWPRPEMTPNPYILLVFSIVAGKAVYRLHPVQAGITGAILAAGAVIPYLVGLPAMPIAFLLFYALLLAAGFTVFRQVMNRFEETAERNEALLTEYRKMKRRVAANEKSARQEERTQIARDIHDSVGHKLTALLMQLEVFRLKSDGQAAQQFGELKALAKESLEETRNAVKTLKHEETGGVSAIIALIRQLEAESFLRIHFSVKAGAFSAPLGNEQMTIVYRAVQEALTNIMRHGGTREADIVFDVPGGSIFRFAITNTVPEKTMIREGFGLSSMRERIEQAGGRLDIIQTHGQFTVQGTLPLPVKKEVKV